MVNEGKQEIYEIKKDEKTGKDVTLLKEDVARGIAHELKPQIDTLKAREQHLIEMAEKGMTEEQEFNIRFMEKIKEKYPYAFKDGIDQVGRRYLEPLLSGLVEANNQIFITEEGIIKFNGRGEAVQPDEINVGKMTDYIVDFRTKNPDFINISLGVAAKSVLDFDTNNARGQMLQRSNELKMTIIDLHNQNGPFNGLLSECFKRSNGIGELEHKKQMEVAGKDKVMELVDSL